VYLELIQDDPYIKRALGPNAQLTPFHSCPVRVGGVAKAYGKRVLVIGDAAGQVDPLTGSMCLRIVSQQYVYFGRHCNSVADRSDVTDGRWYPIRNGGCTTRCRNVVRSVCNRRPRRAAIEPLSTSHRSRVRLAAVDLDANRRHLGALSVLA
jgi:hypothetical protein